MEPFVIIGENAKGQEQVKCNTCGCVVLQVSFYKHIQTAKHLSKPDRRVKSIDGMSPEKMQAKLEEDKARRLRSYYKHHDDNLKKINDLYHLKRFEEKWDRFTEEWSYLVKK